MAHDVASRMIELRAEIVAIQLLAEQQSNNHLRVAVKRVAHAWNQLRWESPIPPTKCRWLQLRLGDDITAGTPPPFDLDEETFK